jgi:hypothetical protein
MLQSLAHLGKLFRAQAELEMLAASLSRFRVACLCVIYIGAKFRMIRQDHSEHFFEKCSAPV